MKGSNKNNASRRAFIKTAAQVAVGSTLVGCACPPKGKKLSATGKPGGHAPHPQGSKFKGELKLPGWLPDTTVIDEQYLFLEEALHKGTGGFDAFAAPRTAAGAFQEPLPTDSPDKWNSFNSWILGAPFTKKPGDDFDALLEEIANCARRYNAALYWMRRLHLYEKAKLLNIPISTPPLRNPHGDHDRGPNDDPAKWTDEDFKRMIPEAQKDWNMAVKGLDSVLKRTGSLGSIWADMIQVNDYIVSMRIVSQTTYADPPKSANAELPTKPKTVPYIGGSSSHISVSSALSSPSPPP